MTKQLNKPNINQEIALLICIGLVALTGIYFEMNKSIGSLLTLFFTSCILLFMGCAIMILFERRL